jgi:glycosyltransferase involved in cell wall biosynthesis
MSIALVHDYLTQRGGAERVVLSMLRAFPGAPLYTSLYDPAGTFPEFKDADVRTLPLNRVDLLRRRHRLAFPVLARAFSRLEIEADTVLCSSSGWAHGTRVSGRKVVFCYTPARWLYQSGDYLALRDHAARAALAALRPWLVRWDRRAASSADVYLTSSTAVRDRIRSAYGIEAELLPPPHTIDPAGSQREVDGLEPGFFLCVSRLLPYKNVDAVIRAFAGLPGERLVVVGAGPEEARLRALAGPNVRLAGSVSDEKLRWLYANSVAVVAASREDYGLTPLEGAAFGKRSAVLRWGGFLDTVVEGTTGVFFDTPAADDVRDAIAELAASPWSDEAIRAHAAQYSEDRFVERLRAVVLDQPTRSRELVPV